MTPHPFAASNASVDIAARVDSARKSGYAGNSGLPLVHRLPADFSLPHAFDRLQSLPGVLWLDSVTHASPSLGRFSFLTADPVFTLQEPTLEQLAEIVRQRLREKYKAL